MSGRRGAVVWALTVILAMAAPAGGSEVRFFRLHTRDAFLDGTLDGLSVDPLGTLRLADRAARLAAIGEPFLFAAAAHPDGWVLGTGNDGKVMLVDRGGEVRTLFTAPEPEIFAVWADPDGTVFAGSSPNGKVYRIAGGEAKPFFDPGETYIWALARAGSGALLVATGTEGRLYRVDAEGRGEVVFDSEDTHLRALKPLPGGEMLAGTAGEGLILKLEPGGRVRTLYDAPQPEVVSFAIDPEGGCYAAVLASEASQIDLSRRPRQRPKEEEPEKEPEPGEPEVKITVTAVDEEPEPITGSRPPRFRGPRSEILQISPAGVVRTLWRFEEETVYSIRWQRDRLWVGTGLEGKLYSLRDRQMVLEKDVDERQVVALLGDRPGPAFATTNAAALYRISGETERRGVYTSAALDAGQIAEFGSLRWEGESAAGTGMAFSFRSGVSSEPDRTWSEWSSPARGSELSVAEVPPGRFLQWRAEFTAADGRSPALSRVEISYRQINLPPRVTKFVALEPGEILVPAGFNPANQVFEPAHPNRQGIFTTLRPAVPTEARRQKKLWKKGYRTLQWEAEDPNEDELRYELSFRPEGAEGGWLTVEEDLEDDFYSFDATALPDGLYRFRLACAPSIASTRTWTIHSWARS